MQNQLWEVFRMEEEGEERRLRNFVRKVNQLMFVKMGTGKWSFHLIFQR